jgi:hypothetical protein
MSWRGTEGEGGVKKALCTISLHLTYGSEFVTGKRVTVSKKYKRINDI